MATHHVQCRTCCNVYDQTTPKPPVICGACGSFNIHVTTRDHEPDPDETGDCRICASRDLDRERSAP